MFPDYSGSPEAGTRYAPSDGGGVHPGPDDVRVAILGEVAVRRETEFAAVAGARGRVLVAALALHPGRSRSASALIDDIWGEQPPRAPMNALHTQVSRLRSVLPEGALEIGPAGYRLLLRADQVDLSLVGELEGRARRQLEQSDHAGGVESVLRARALWRGVPGADLASGPVADELHELAAAHWSDLNRLELTAREAGGDIAGALRMARGLAAAEPLNEPAHATLMRLLAGDGRATEALETFAGLRTRLGAELGADPGQALVALNTAILRGEPVSGSVAPGSARTSVPEVSGGPVVSGAGSTESGASHGAPVAGGSAASSATEPPGVAPSAKGPGAAGSSRPGFSAAVPAAAGSSAAWPAATQRVSSAQHAVAGEQPDTGAAPGTLAAPQNSAIGLRAAPNPLLGRDGDLAALEQLVTQFRVTTVLGPGGTGKTRVANELGARLAPHQPVALVELASLHAESEGSAAERMNTTGLDIEAAIGAALGVSEYTRETNVLRRSSSLDAGRRLREALALRPMLLILDNCEHLVDAVAEVVADLVGSCARLTVVTTSRAPLSITAETVYPLPPLAIDSHGSPATELFVSRARAVRPSVRLDPEVVARLCHTLDGLPLAIELAAARVRAMSVEEIENRLEHRFALLRSGDRSSPERHRTLHAVIEWSWNLLDPEQQAALRRLCRFPGGFTLQAAESVVGGPEVLDAVAAVDGLVSQSLLTVLADDDAVDTRYRMLETVREFGAEQLTAAGEDELVMQRMGEWAKEFVFRVVRDYDGPDQVRTVLSVAAEVDNLLVVLRYAIENGDARTVYTIFGPVAALWVMRGAHAELMGWATRVAPLRPSPVGLGPGEADLEMLSYAFLSMHLAFGNRGLRPVAIARTGARRLLARDDLRPLTRFMGELLCSPLHVASAIRLLAAGTRSADTQTRGAALLLRANLRENAGYAAGSIRDAKQAIALTDGRDVWATAMCCQHLGQMAAQSARYEESVTHYRRAVELMQQLRCYEEGVEMRSFLAVSMVGAGQLAQARSELEYALGVVDDGGSDEPVVQPNQRKAVVVSGLAELALVEGDIESGLRTFRRCLELFGWPDMSTGPGPGDVIVAAAVLDAHILNNATHEAPGLAGQIARSAREKLGQFIDLPQIGGVACALGSYLIHRDIDRRTGAILLALARKVLGRQDYSSMRWSRHLELARAVGGNELVEYGQHAVSRMNRRSAAQYVMQLLPDIERKL